MKRSIWFSAGILSFLTASAALAQSPRTLYTWSGTGDARGWAMAFGDNAVTIENAVDEELTITETGGAGATVAIADNGDIISEGGPSTGGLDVTGLSALELELGHDGAGPVVVQFYVQAAPTFDFVGLGPDQEIVPGVATYTAPLDVLTPAQAAYIRVIGINIRDHAEEGDLVWTLREVRTVGEPLDERFFATHEADSSDSGLQGAFVNFENAAVMGNDGGQNQTGLSLNTTDTPPGNTGSLQWTDLAGQGGGAVTWVNGTVFNGNSFNERPTDMSNYEKVVVRMAATNVEGGLVEAVGVQYFIQSANFNFHQAGAIVNLPADGEFHELEFLITAVPRLDFVDTHGINLQEHAGGDLIIDIDSLRAVAPLTITDCNQNGIDDGRDLVDG
ncbi:MAG TPA: hypothetical protein VMT52_10915, partial [Planctomycetota bacterium]|nr:hypothetical protein [Planctomycetota bacterium]